MFTLEENAGDVALMSLCGWSLGYGGSMHSHIMRCSSAHNHGLYTLVVTDVATDLDSNSTVVVGLSVEYMQSGSVQDTLGSTSGLDVFSPEVAVFSLDCVPQADNIGDGREVHTPRSNFMRIDGTFDGLPLSVLNSVRQNGSGGNGVLGADNLTLITDGGVMAAEWAVQYSTLDLKKLYHFEAVPDFPRLVVGLSSDPEVYRETGEFLPLGHYNNLGPDGSFSHEEDRSQERSEFFLCFWASDPSLDADIADEDGVLACSNSDDLEITFFTPSSVAYDGDTGDAVVNGMRILAIESGDALLAQATGAVDAFPGILVSDLLRVPDGDDDGTNFIFNTRTAYADPTGDAGALYPNMVRRDESRPGHLCTIDARRKK